MRHPARRPGPAERPGAPGLPSLGQACSALHGYVPTLAGCALHACAPALGGGAGVLKRSGHQLGAGVQAVLAARHAFDSSLCSSLPPPTLHPAAGVSVKYGKKLLGKLQRAPAAAAALAAATAAAAEVLAPGFDEAMAAAEAAERRANPAAALPDDLFSDEPLPAARQPCAAERRAAEVEAALEAALAEARSLRAFLQEAELEAADAALAALQQRRQAREAQQAAAAAAAAVAAAAAQQQGAPPLGLTVGNGHLSQLPLLASPASLLAPSAVGALHLPGAAAPAAAGGAAGHDGLNPENECVICLADIRCVPRRRCAVQCSARRPAQTYEQPGHFYAASASLCSCMPPLLLPLAGCAALRPPSPRRPLIPAPPAGACSACRAATCASAQIASQRRRRTANARCAERRCRTCCRSSDAPPDGRLLPAGCPLLLRCHNPLDTSFMRL